MDGLEEDVGPAGESGPELIRDSSRRQPEHRKGRFRSGLLVGFVLGAFSGLFLGWIFFGYLIFG